MVMVHENSKARNQTVASPAAGTGLALSRPVAVAVAAAAQQL